jgi:hypothetical protein
VKLADIDHLGAAGVARLLAGAADALRGDARRRRSWRIRTTTSCCTSSSTATG